MNELGIKLAELIKGRFKNWSKNNFVGRSLDLSNLAYFSICEVNSYQLGKELSMSSLHCGMIWFIFSSYDKWVWWLFALEIPTLIYYNKVIYKLSLGINAITNTSSSISWTSLYMLLNSSTRLFMLQECGIKNFRLYIDDVAHAIRNTFTSLKKDFVENCWTFPSLWPYHEKLLSLLFHKHYAIQNLQRL